MAAKALFLILLPVANAYMSRYSCNTTDDIKKSQGIADEDFFCGPFVNYTVACDLDDDPALGFNPSCNNSFAIQVYANFERALSVYSCREYSRIWTCDNCTASYRRWMCSALFKKCHPTLACPANFTRTQDKAQPDCIIKTCQDVCYDVVRKCPVHLDFVCPPVNDLREYAPSSCNNLERPSTSAASRRARQTPAAVGGGLAAAAAAMASLLAALASARV